MDTSSRGLPLSVSLFVWALGTWALGTTAPAQDRSLRFKWPVPSDVDVTEERIQSGRSLVVGYRVELRPGEGDNELVVRRRDFEILEIDKLDVTPFQQVIAPMRAQMGTLPDLRIDAHGRILGVETWEDFAVRLEQPVTEYVENGLLTEDHAERILENLRSPQTKENMYARATEFWTLWVSGWLDNDFSGSDTVVAETDFPLPNGEIVRGPQTLRHQGPVADHAGHVRLSMELTLTGDEIRHEAIRMASQQLQEPPVPGAPPPIRPEAIRSAEAGNEAWLIVRPNTMQPLEAQTENRMIITAREAVQEIVDRRHFKFVWK